MGISTNIVALDLETTCTLGCESKSQCYSDGHALYPHKNKITVIGIWSPTWSCTIRDEGMKDLLSLLRERNLYFVGQNLTFDIRQLHFHLGAEVAAEVKKRWLHDTQVMVHACTDKIPKEWLDQYELNRREKNKSLPKGFSHREAGANSLKTNAPYWLGVEAFWEDPTNHDSDQYVLQDCEYTYRLMTLFLTKLDSLQQREFYEKKMMPWAKFLSDCELRGIELDKKALKEIREEKLAKLQELEIKLNDQWVDARRAYVAQQTKILEEEYKAKKWAAIQKIKNPTPEKKEKVAQRYLQLFKKAFEKIEPLSYNSPKQMLWLLKDYLKLNVNTFDGEESTGVEVLERLAAEGREDIKVYLEYRGVEKILSAFLPTYEDLAINGVIHANLNLCGTRTGRLSSSNPNLQQVPPELYKIFKPREGYKFIIYDLEAIEGKLIALFAQDLNLYDIITKDESIHDHNAKIFFDLDCEINEVKSKFPAERAAAKTVGFALFYGAGANRITTSFTSAGFPVDRRTADGMLRNFRERFADATETHRELTKLFENGDVVPNILGRPLRIQPHENAFMQGFNRLVQSTASDLNLNIAYNAQQEYYRQDLDAHVLLLVHDMILIEAKEDVAEKAEKILLHQYDKIKLSGPLGPIKITASGGISDRWEK